MLALSNLRDSYHTSHHHCLCNACIVPFSRLIVSVLPSGPTAFFKVSNVVTSGDIFNHGKVTAHQPEIILNNFNTRLGHRVGRFLGSFYPHVRLCLWWRNCLIGERERRPLETYRLHPVSLSWCFSRSPMKASSASRPQPCVKILEYDISWDQQQYCQG